MSEQPVKRPANNANAVARRKAIRRKKLIKKRLILAGMVLGALIIIGLIIFGIVKLVGKGLSETTTMMIAKDGSITMDEVSDFSESNYSEDELDKYTNELVDDYNDNGNVGKVKFKKLKVKDGKAYLRMEYSDYNAYKLFTGNELFVGTIGEAKAAGYDFNDTFSSVSDEKKSEAVTVEDITSDDDKKVVLVRANENIEVPGTIKIVSDACTTIVKKDEISIAQPDGNEDATVLTTIVYE